MALQAGIVVMIYMMKVDCVAVLLTLQ